MRPRSVIDFIRSSGHEKWRQEKSWRVKWRVMLFQEEFGRHSFIIGERLKGR